MTSCLDTCLQWFDVLAIIGATATVALFAWLLLGSDRR